MLNAEANVEIDITAADALEQLRREVTAMGMMFAMARVKQDLRDDLIRPVWWTVSASTGSSRRCRPP